MLKYKITHGCEIKDSFCACNSKVEGESIQDIINQIDKIENDFPIYRIEKLVEMDKTGIKKILKF